MLVPCPGCKKTYNHGISMSNHQRKCSKLKIVTKERLFRRQKNAKKRQEAKILKIEAEDTGLDMRNNIRERSNDVLEAGDATSGRKRKLRSQESGSKPMAYCMPIDETKRIRLCLRIPKRFWDELPPAPPYIPSAEDPLDEIDSQSSSASNCTAESDRSTDSSSSTSVFRTEPDSYGVLREYAFGKPSITPDKYHTLSTVSDTPHLALDSGSEPRNSSICPITTAERYFYKPFRNPSIYRLMSWFYRPSNTKSRGELNALVKDVILAPDFSPNDFAGFNAAKEQTLMDNHQEPRNSSRFPNPFSGDDKWIKGIVEIPLPCDGFGHEDGEIEAPKFKVEVYYRKLIDVVTSALSEPAAEMFHTFPFEAFWKPSPDEPEERVYSELFTGDIWNAEYEKIFTSARDSHPDLEAFIVALMIWSDSTHLAQFGSAELWPIYLYIGNSSKYTRANPSSFSAHHVAYMPKLGQDIQDFYRKWFGKPATAEMLTHLKRELIHAVWMLLLDDDFMHAYIHGLIIQLADLIARLFLPRFMIYSADYQEKVLIACIKFLARCPCPRCLVLKSKANLVGSKTDMRTREKECRTDSHERRWIVERARRMMFVDGINVSSSKIEKLLQPQSLVPTRNAFSERLFEHGFNFFQMFVPDFLHEFELGVWKAVFTHLMRILYAYGHDTIQILNERYRQIPSYGRDTIRRFDANASAMKKLAARDFEDLLQCAIPVFEGLLPPQHDTIVRKLLFEASTYHGLAKLRLHTERTVTELEHSATRLGEILRTFQTEVCSAYDTNELPSEEAARGRRNAKKMPSSKKKTKLTQPNSEAAQRSRRRKLFNLNTYKVHALGAYPRAIRMFGTADNYNSQIGEREHRRGKRHYSKVRKGKKYHVIGIGQQVRRERLIHRLQERNKKKRANDPGLEDTDDLTPMLPEEHYKISKDTRQKIDLTQFLHENKNDPAVKDFLPRLKNHLLSRLLNQEYDGDELDFTPSDRRLVIIENNTIYHHKVLRVNYTTYDLQRVQDSLNPRIPGHADIVVLSPENVDDNEDPHPYWYARILGIYHANIRHIAPNAKSREPQKMDFLFVRWFGRDLTPKPGWKAKRLIRLGFVPGNDEVAFGFLDPAQVIRSIHLIPAFHWGVVTKYLPRSIIARGPGTNPDEDWQLYYIGMFSDRDLIMRFRGGGVGHKSTREATDHFKTDRDKLDILQTEGAVGKGLEGTEVENLDVPTVDEEGDYGYTREESDTNEDEGLGDDSDTDSGYGDHEPPLYPSL